LTIVHLHSRRKFPATHPLHPENKTEFSMNLFAPDKSANHYSVEENFQKGGYWTEKDEKHEMFISLQLSDS
jgi:hypothetical protein